MVVATTSSGDGATATAPSRGAVATLASLLTDVARTVLLGAVAGAGFHLGSVWVRDKLSAVAKTRDADEKRARARNDVVPSATDDQDHDHDHDKRPRSESLASALTAETASSSDRHHDSDASGGASKARYLEMLVHNVAHTDLVLSIDGSRIQHGDGDEDEKKDDASSSASPRASDLILCRPRFSAFALFSGRVVDALSSSSSSSPGVVSFPRHGRDDASPRLVSRRSGAPTPVGLDLGVDGPAVAARELPSLRLRGRDCARVPDSAVVMEAHQRGREEERRARDERTSPRPPPTTTEALSSSSERSYHLRAVFLPLLATLAERWDESLRHKYSTGHEVKKVVVLLSGVGSPRNWTHSVEGNSTENLSKLMEYFLKLIYPDVTIVRIHSNSNVFRYDENILFTKQELLPVIDSYRDAHARGLPYPDEVATKSLSSSSFSSVTHAFDPDWKSSFSVTLSFADGSPARTHAVQTALRPYRPTYFHVWQLKTFWHETKITSDDVEVHAFEEMETAPALGLDRVSPEVRRVTEEILRFRDEYLDRLADPDNDVERFWLRKTRKPVLAVLAARDRDRGGGATRLYRGTNMEVSMPTGSLCAERNVIGTALAVNPGLKREDLVMVAVLAVPLANVARDLPPPVDRDDTGDNAVGFGLRRTMSLTNCASVVEERRADDDDWVADVGLPVIDGEGSVAVPPTVPPLDLGSSTSPPRTPARRVRIFPRKVLDADENGYPNVPESGRPRRRCTVVVHSQSDINPLAPCGACNEWLKKIAESNPYFKVLTYTDVDCNGVYVNRCQE